MLHRVLITIAVLFGFLILVPIVNAQGGPDKYPEGVDPTDVYRIARHLYCDVCAGVPLSDCPSTQCQVWREEIGQLLADGYTEDEIRQHFADRYGEQVSGVPLNRNDQLLVFLLPLGISLLAIGFIGWRIYLWRESNTKRALEVARSAGTRPEFNRPVPDNVDPTYLERVLADVEALRR
ncbi:MAG: hypothetical protein CUN55_05865 [Phototrophicales bacterium]|nr:MAG: hypothetical protein CUN55_05865 [Phototrophicales bacterium]